MPQNDASSVKSAAERHSSAIMRASDQYQARKIFLAALRSGEYPKGTIVTDEQGRPLFDNPSEPGWCVVGLAHTLFSDPLRPASMVPVRQALGVSRQFFTHVQHVWNDSALTFSEIADLIEGIWGKAKNCCNE